MKNIVIKNKEILEYYSKNNRDIETDLLFLINFVKEIDNSEIKRDNLEEILKDINRRLEDNDIINKENNSDFKEEIIKDLKEVINNQNNNIELKINNKLDNIQQNMFMTINEMKNILPDKNYILDRIHDELKIYKNNNNMKDIEQLFNKEINKIYIDVVDKIHNTENKLTDVMSDIKNTSTNLVDVSHNTFNKIDEHLQLFNNSSKKGIVGENLLHNLLLNEFPHYDIVKTTNDKSYSGDFIITIDEHITIMIENKYYNDNVNTNEIKKFYRDINKNNFNGAIFISQSSGIVAKNDLEISLMDKTIVVFISNCNYNIDKIKIAINSIIHINKHIHNNNDNKIYFDKDVINKVNNDITLFNDTREKLIIQLKNYYNDTLKIYNSMYLNNVQLLIADFYSDKKETVCKFCKKYKHINKRSVSRHEYSCKKKYCNIDNTSR